jgi:hypothetical protein
MALLFSFASTYMVVAWWVLVFSSYVRTKMWVL